MYLPHTREKCAIGLKGERCGLCVDILLKPLDLPNLLLSCFGCWLFLLAAMAPMNYRWSRCFFFGSPASRLCAASRRLAHVRDLTTALVPLKKLPGNPSICPSLAAACLHRLSEGSHRSHFRHSCPATVAASVPVALQVWYYR